METVHSRGKAKLIIAFFAAFASSLIILLTILSITPSTQPQTRTARSISHTLKRSEDEFDHRAAAVVESTCSSTLYPELCVATLKEAKPFYYASSAIASSRDVMITALNYTIYTVQRNYFTIKKMGLRRKESLTPREKVALHDCLEVIGDTLAELRVCGSELRGFGSTKNYTAGESRDKVMSLLSAAQTNQESCLDGFSHDGADRKIRRGLIKGQMHVFKLVSNVLAMFKNISDADVGGSQGVEIRGRKLGEGDNGDGGEWPRWMSEADRRILQATTVTPDVTVAADGSGNYLTVAAAVAAAPEGRTSRYVIRIKAGVYRENVEVPRRKTNLMFVGDGRTTTIITGSRSVGGGSTTFNSATVAVVGDGFLARDITFQNTAGPSNHQAVALRVNADLTAFYRCDMIAYQDTLYVHSLRQFYTGCYIAGTVDFIFGNAAAVLQNCDIRARRPNPNQRNMVTAQGRTDPNQNTGIVIQKCTIGATSDLQAVQGSFRTYLGRPWKAYSRTVVMQTSIGNVIDPAGWYPWDGSFALDTLFYAEYANTGSGADTSGRVTWRGFRVLTSASQAQPFTAGNFIAGGNWLPATGFPYSLGL